MTRWSVIVAPALGVLAALTLTVGSAGATARRECSETRGLLVYAQGRSTTCGFARATAEAVAAYAADHENGLRAHFGVGAQGRTMACHHYSFDSLETFGCNGKMRSVLLQRPAR